jgi:hypothetical protein
MALYNGMAGTNTWTNVGADGDRGDTDNWSLGHVPVDGTETVVFGAASTTNSGPNINALSISIGNYNFTGSIGETITAPTITAGNGFYLGNSSSNLLTLVGNYSDTATGAVPKNLNIVGNFTTEATSTGLTYITVSGNVSFSGTGSGTNFTVRGTTLTSSASAGTLTGVFTGLVTTGKSSVANVTGTLNGGLAYTPNSGTTLYYNTAAAKSLATHSPISYGLSYTLA